MDSLFCCTARDPAEERPLTPRKNSLEKHTPSAKPADAEVPNGPTEGAPVEASAPAPEAPEPTVGHSSSIVKVFNIVDPQYADSTGHLDTGYLLQAMDAATCMSAERHAKVSCVTAAVDDLHVEAPAPLGFSVEVCAQISCVFGKSMEVRCQAHMENPLSGEITHICTAYFTYVALGPDGKAIVLPALLPADEEERLRVARAKSRKQERIGRKNVVRAGEDISRHIVRTNTTEGDAGPRACRAVGDVPTETLAGIQASSTCIQSSYLVLPNHANHHGNTFGGQIMTWMSHCVLAAATRLLRCRLRITSVDDVFFIAPSAVGDRIIVKVAANRTFVDDNVVEIGARVEAVDVAGVKRRINQAYFTVAAFPESAEEALTLREVIPDSPDAERRFHKAIGRQRVRLNRTTIRRGISIKWDDTLAGELAIKAINGLLESAQAQEWQPLYQADGVTHSIKERSANVKDGDGTGNGSLCLKMSFSLNCSPQDIFKVLLDAELRPQWDAQVDVSKTFHKLPEHPNVDLHYMVRRGKGAPEDFVLIRAWQESEGWDEISRGRTKSSLKQGATDVPHLAGADSATCFIASTSIEHIDYPEQPGLTRGEVASSGFILGAYNAEIQATPMSYLVHLGPAAIKLLVPSGGAGPNQDVVKLFHLDIMNMKQSLEKVANESRSK